jgi:hypothetical protein
MSFTPNDEAKYYIKQNHFPHPPGQALQPPAHFAASDTSRPVQQ